MRTLWRDDVASFGGDFVRFDAIRVNPKPLDWKAIPIVLGGNSDAALRRVARWGDGWYGFNLDRAGEAAQRVRYLRASCDDAGRDIADLHVAVALRDQTPPTSRNSPKPASTSWSSSRNRRAVRRRQPRG
jgi:alkanesulfonate monooxygenase SsuD/methylene tetrahydromethanopterin reductase-like flavin-dependent oxidoreductase (luciferase family)